jgi:hypothetical protein
MPSPNFHQVPESAPFDEAAEWEVGRWDDPEIIVDPVTGIVLAVIRPADLPRRPLVATVRTGRKPSLWRSMVGRWLALAGGDRRLRFRP